MLRLFALFLCVMTVCAYIPKLQTTKLYKNVGWLMLHRVPATWDEARRTCELVGGILASPTTGPLLVSLVDMMTDHRQLPCGVFTGIHSTYTKGNYYTINGVPLSKIPARWAEDNPANNQVAPKCAESFKDCLILLSDGSLADVDCNSHYPFICYKMINNTKTGNRPCSTMDYAYRMDPRTGNCYKFHSAGQTWHQAAKTCSDEGGYLAIINSQTEAEVLKELFATFQRINIESDYKDTAMLGYLAWGEQRSWATIHGQTLEEAGYESWSPGEPNNAPRKTPSGQLGQACGSMLRTALLDDIWCDDAKCAFICEKNPEVNGEVFEYC